MAGLNSELMNRIKGDPQSLLYELLKKPEGDAETVLQDIESIDNFVKQGLDRIFKEYSNATITDRYGERHSFRFQQFVDLCHSLREAIHDSIFEIYQLKADYASRLGAYSQLLATFDTGKESNIYTTNYDRIIESFCARTEGYEMRDGFEYDPKTRMNLWRPSSFDAPLSDNVKTVKLYKLHGSLNWKVGENGLIERVSPEIRLEHRPTAIHKADILIYPGSKEPPEDEPFRTIYDRFELEMKETKRCLVIGFSFRDQYLNRIFRDFIRRGDRQLLVMGKSCKETVAKNLLGLKETDDLKAYAESNTFIPIPCHFGEQDWITRLRNGELLPYPR